MAFRRHGHPASQELSLLVSRPIRQVLSVLATEKWQFTKSYTKVFTCIRFLGSSRLDPDRRAQETATPVFARGSLSKIVCQDV